MCARDYSRPAVIERKIATFAPSPPLRAHGERHRCAHKHRDAARRLGGRVERGDRPREPWGAGKNCDGRATVRLIEPISATGDKAPERLRLLRENYHDCMLIWLGQNRLTRRTAGLTI
jgi:hypothetical protein